MNTIAPPTCPYCKGEALLTTGDRVYPNRPDLASLKFWCCHLCDAWVGCHKPGTHRVEGGQRIENGEANPLGRLANAELRRAKSAAHAAFDPLWKAHGMSRHRAYAWLAKQMGLSLDQTHIGEFDVAQCRQAAEICKGGFNPLAKPSCQSPEKPRSQGRSPRQETPGWRSAP